MRLSNNYILNFRNLTLALCFVFWALNSAQAQTSDLDRIWTTVGSAGTVDETDNGKVFFDHGVVQMGHVLVNQPAAARRAIIFQQTQSAVIRYNVTPVDGLFAPRQQCQPGRDCPGIELKLRYLATGSGARVIAKLIEVDLATGAENTRLTFNSNGFATANGYHVQAAGECGPLWRFDFKHKAYYIEATLTGNRIAAVGASGIQMIKIDNIICKG
jgi:hypothetical protein